MNIKTKDQQAINKHICQISSCKKPLFQHFHNDRRRGILYICISFFISFTPLFSKLIVVVPMDPYEEMVFFNTAHYWGDVFRIASRKGHIVKMDSLKGDTKDLVDQAEIILLNGIGPRMGMHQISHLPKEKLVTILWEPYIITPWQYQAKFLRNFHRVLTFRDDLVDEKTFFKFLYPVNKLRVQTKSVPFEKRKLACMMLTGKTSNLEGENLSHRFRVADFFETIPDEVFDLYGKGWDKYRNAKGYVKQENKYEEMAKHRFVFAFENSSNHPGYIAEKPFDVFLSGAVPIYLGAPNVTDYFPEGTFIDARNFSSMEVLYLFLKEMKEETYLGYLERIASFLSGKAGEPFTVKSHVKRILRDAMQIEISDEEFEVLYRKH